MTSRFSHFFLSGFFFFSLVLTALPFSVGAAGLIPCGRSGADATAAERAPCTICHIIVGGKGIIDWGLRVMTFAAIAVIVAMAIFYIVSTGNEGMMTTAKGGIKAALVGFAVMLSAWLIINMVLSIMAVDESPGKPLSGLRQNGTFSFTCDTSSSAGSAQGPGIPTAPGASTGVVTTGPLPTGCAAYKNDFESIGTASGVPAKLLQSIAAAESNCNPNITSSVGSCGLMQLQPSTVGKSCEELKSNPTQSIQLAANYFKTLQGNLNAYKTTFDIGNSFSLSSVTANVSATNGQTASFNSGNDDLIAAYNAGSGNSFNSSGQKGPFMLSSDCPAANNGGKNIPAWQCPMNPVGFSETQTYVQRVQGFMKQ